MNFVPFLSVMMLILMLLLIVNSHGKAKQQLRARLKVIIKSHGGTDIWLSQGSGWEDPHMVVFRVNFRDVNGVEWQTRCRVRPRRDQDIDILWENEPFLSGYQAQLEATRSENAEMRSRLTTRSATKEQIISELARENEQLKVELQALKAQTLGGIESK